MCKQLLLQRLYRSKYICPVIRITHLHSLEYRSSSFEWPDHFFLLSLGREKQMRRKLRKLGGLTIFENLFITNVILYDRVKIACKAHFACEACSFQGGLGHTPGKLSKNQCSKVESGGTFVHKFHLATVLSFITQSICLLHVRSNFQSHDQFVMSQWRG